MKKLFRSFDFGIKNTKIGPEPLRNFKKQVFFIRKRLKKPISA